MTLSPPLSFFRTRQLRSRLGGCLVNSMPTLSMDQSPVVSIEFVYGPPPGRRRRKRQCCTRWRNVAVSSALSCQAVDGDLPMKAMTLTQRDALKRLGSTALSFGIIYLTLLAPASTAPGRHVGA